MRPFWGIVQFVAQTLAMQLVGLDDDGIDARFTNNGSHLDETEMKGLKGLEKLEKKLDAGQPKGPWFGHPEYVTDIANILDGIFTAYWKKSDLKKTTLIVLTNGLWKGSKSDLLYKAITGFVQQLEKQDPKLPARHFSITFVRFGEFPEAMERLIFLDDRLCIENDLG